MPHGYADSDPSPHLVQLSPRGKRRINERTPLIKPGVKPDVRRTPEDVKVSEEVMKRAEIGLGRMVELGLPLIMCVSSYIEKMRDAETPSAHEISRTIFRWRRMGCLEAVGPAVSAIHLTQIL
jgi:putative membrane protein